MVLSLKKALYGTKQASRLWQQTLFKWLEAEGFKQCRSDPCLFVRRNESGGDGEGGGNGGGGDSDSGGQGLQLLQRRDDGGGDGSGSGGGARAAARAAAEGGGNEDRGEGGVPVAETARVVAMARQW